MNNRHLLIIFLGIMVVMLAACGSSPTEPTADLAAGEALFKSGGGSGIPCITCHTLDGSALVGPSLEGIGQRAGEQIPDVTAEEYIRQSIVDPSAYLVSGYSDAMNKTYGATLSEEDIDNLIAFLMTQ